MSWKVLITARTMNEVGLSALDRMREAGCEIVLPPKPGPMTAHELLNVLPDSDAVLASMDQFTSAVLESPSASCLKIISRWGVGYDAIDVASATRQGIVVAYTVRAVSPGRYAHPPAIVEDMYRPDRFARTAAGTVEVTAR